MIPPVLSRVAAQKISRWQFTGPFNAMHKKYTLYQMRQLPAIHKHLAKICLFAALAVVFLLLPSRQAAAQGVPDIVNLSGIIVDGDSAYGVPGVHVIIKNANTGTVSNGVGFFSLPVIEGDTVTFSSVGFKKQQMIIPEIEGRGLSVLIDLQTDTTFLPVIEVFPYPTEEIFKEAFLALRLPDQHMENVARNLDPRQLQRMAAAMPMDGSSNHRLYMNQQANRISNQFFAPTFSILNPFAWAEFIRSVKRGDLKKKD